MGRIKYVHVPEQNAYYKAQEDCCFEIVSYDKNKLGVVEKMDDIYGKDLNSWDFICRCHPSIEILEIDENEYLKRREDVLKKIDSTQMKVD